MSLKDAKRAKRVWGVKALVTLGRDLCISDSAKSISNFLLVPAYSWADSRQDGKDWQTTNCYPIADHVAVCTKF